MNTACTIVAHFQSIIIILSFGLQSFCPFCRSFFGSLSCSHFTWYNTAIKRAIYFHFTFGYPRQSTSFNEFNTLFILLNCWNSRIVETMPLLLLLQLLWLLLLRSHKQIVGKKWQIDKCKFKHRKCRKPHQTKTQQVNSVFHLNYLVFHFNQSVKGEQIVKLNNSVELMCLSIVPTENSNAIYLISNHCHFGCQFSGTPISNNWIWARVAKCWQPRHS